MAEHSATSAEHHRHHRHQKKKVDPASLLGRMKRHNSPPESHKHVAEPVSFDEYMADLSHEERHTFEKFYEEVKDREDISEELKDYQIVLMFLRGKKFNTERTLLVMKNFMKTRAEMGNISIATIAHWLASGVSYSIPDARDKDGHKVFMVEARHQPADEDKYDRAHGMAYFLERDLNSPVTQRVGITVVLDMRNAPFRMDSGAQKQLSKMLQDAYPVRIGAIYVVQPPWFFKVLLGAIKIFIKAKVLQRMKVVTEEELAEHIAPKFLPKALGGTSTYDHAEWIEEQYQLEGLEPSDQIKAEIQALKNRPWNDKLKSKK